MNRRRGAFTSVLALGLWACAHQARPIAASTWPPPCAGSRILEVTNPTGNDWDVAWGDERLGTARPGISRLRVPSILIQDARLVGGPTFRAQASRTSLPGPVITGAKFRLLCE